MRFCLLLTAHKLVYGCIIMVRPGKPGILPNWFSRAFMPGIFDARDANFFYLNVTSHYDAEIDTQFETSINPSSQSAKKPWFSKFPSARFSGSVIAWHVLRGLLDLSRKSSGHLIAITRIK